jgi:hypothetical protein
MWMPMAADKLSNDTSIGFLQIHCNWLRKNVNFMIQPLLTWSAILG